MVSLPSPASSLPPDASPSTLASATLPAELEEPSAALEDLALGPALAAQPPATTEASQEDEAGSGGHPETEPAAERRKEDKGKGKAVDQDDGEQDGERERESEKALERFSCHICLDLPEKPVLTPCGHMYCWPCMHEWLIVSSGRACPVCKASLAVDRLIPVYAGGEEEKDPRAVPLPPRPKPTNTTPSSSFRAPRSLFSSSSSSFTFQAGVFPLPGLSMAWSWPPQQPAQVPLGPPADVEEERVRLGLMGDPHAGGRVNARDAQWQAMAQQVFVMLFFAVFVAMTLSG
ncbi:hypothetical protein JCM10213_003862 [Rhodosporidiobolus nylandii]